MDQRATVRVRPREGQSGRPDRALLETTADILAGQGFEVLKVGRFGVSIAGDDKTFGQELGVSVHTDRLVAMASPRDPRLADLIDMVEIAPSPTRF